MKKWLLILITAIASCTSPPSKEEQEWERICQLKQFDFFFNFALHTADSTLMLKSIDSLPVYGPTNSYAIINLVRLSFSDTDSIGREWFSLDTNEYHLHGDIEKRNLLTIFLDKHDSISVFSKVYFGQPLANLIRQMHDTTLTDTAGLFPERMVVEIGKRLLTIKKMGILYHVEMFPDSSENHASWKQLVFEMRTILSIIDSLRNEGALALWEKPYAQANRVELFLLERLFPYGMTVCFNLPINQIPPPPPPPDNSVVQ